MNFHSVFHLREDIEEFILTDHLEIHFLELPKLGAEQQGTNDLLVNWLLFLKAESDEKLEELAMSEPTIQKAIHVLEFLSQDAEARRLYEMREKALKDEVSMIEGAKEEGRVEEKIDIAKEMLAEGESLERIVKFTKLPLEEIEKLKQQLH